jgi:hypothetical protein
MVVHVDGGTRLPQGGIVFNWPEADSPGVARLNGKPATWRGNELTITELPADVTIGLRTPTTRVMSRK